MNKAILTLRYAALPGLLLIVFLAQQQWPEIHRYGALWSVRPRWWQFFTCNFLSGNWIHLLFNVLSMAVLHWQFGPRVRLPVILLLFTVFSSSATWIYAAFWMPPKAWLVGASGGIYTLFGFFGWFFRRARVGWFGLRALSMPLLAALPLIIAIEALIAHLWLPQLAWPMHAAGISAGFVFALGLQAVCALCRNVTTFQTIIHALELREPIAVME